MPTGHAEPYTIGIGTIVEAFQGTNCYSVITDGMGRYQASWHNGFTGYPGVRNGGGLQPLTRVLLAFTPTSRRAIIVCPINVAWIQTANEPTQVMTYPQVAGFRLNQGLVGQLYAGNLGNLRNYPSDVADDLVNGEWAISSPNGPGVGVELFRSFVRGGAMSGLWCFDTGLTRLAGLDYEFRTLAEDDYDHRQGSVLTASRSRVFYPTEALTDELPRVLEVTGAIHGGTHRYIGPSSDRNVKTPRPALFHEHIGTDGTYLVESASGIHLVRSVAAVMPEESEAPVVASGLTGEQPLDADALRESIAASPRSGLSTIQALPLPWLQHSIDTVQAAINKSRGGFDRLPTQWPNLSTNPQTFFTSYNRDMWRALPTTVQVTIDSTEKAKVFYVGRSSVSLNPDGSIVIEDAWHSQILMAGGNIQFSAAHDIVFGAGRNILGIAGQTAALRANRNVDISANTGRVSIKAETDVSILGGNGGAGGVLIESKGENEETKVGTGEAQTVGGVVIKSDNAGVFIAGAQVGVAATETNVVVSAPGRIQMLTEEFIMRITQVMIYTSPTGTLPAYFLSDVQMLVPGALTIAGQLQCSSSFFLDGTMTATGAVNATGGTLQVAGNVMRQLVRPEQASITSLEQQIATIVTSEDKLITAALALDTPLNAKVEPTIGFSFPTSKQLGLDIPQAFSLPETRWQTVSRRAGKGSSQSWRESPVATVDGDAVKTSAFPGYEAWTSAEGYRLHNTDLCFSLTTGVVLPPLEGPIQIGDFDYTPLNGNYMIGNE